MRTSFKSGLPCANRMVRWGVLSVALAGLPAWAGAQARSGRAPVASAMSAADTAAFEQAMAALDANRGGDALPVLERLVAHYPANYPANETLAQVYAEAGRSSEALKLFEHAARLAPGEAIARANLGAAYLAAGEALRAAAELEAAEKLDPQSPQTASNLGRAWLLAGRPSEAARAFALAEKLQPGDADALYNESVALAAARRPAEALATLRRIPAAAANDQSAELTGELLEQTGDFKGAVEQYQVAAKLNASAENLYALDAELLKHWTWDQALSVSRFATGRYPQDARFPLTSAIALFGKGDYPAAAAEAAALLKASPDSAVDADLLGRSCEAAGEAAAAQCTQLKSFAQAHPGNAQVAVFAATALLESPVDHQETQAAQHLLEQAIAANPALPQAHYQLAVLAQQRSAWDESRVELEKAIALKPEYAAAHYRLSRAYAHLGRREDAKRESDLNQQYSEKEKDQLNARMQEVVLFLLKPS